MTAPGAVLAHESVVSALPVLVPVLVVVVVAAVAVARDRLRADDDPHRDRTGPGAP